MNSTSPRESLALLEIGNLAPALLVADRCAKIAGVRILGIESADSAAQCIKLAGAQADVQAAGEAGLALGRQMGTTAELVVLAAPREETTALAAMPPVYNPLLEIYDARVPQPSSAEFTMSKQNFDAIGLLETQGLVAALHATDEMLKGAAVTLVGKEKIGAAYVTIIVRGDVAAVQSAIDSGKQTVERLGGKLIMADVIARPHPELAALLPKQVALGDRQLLLWPGAPGLYADAMALHTFARHRALFILATFLVAGGPAASAKAEAPKTHKAAHESLRRQLLSMREVDQAARNAAIKFSSSESEEVRQMIAVDWLNTLRMRWIIAARGWPGRSLVGDDGAAAAWLLVQHADLDVRFQARCLELMKQARQQGEVSAQDWAYLVDRVRVNQQQPQVYGTQFRLTDDGQLVPQPIEDEANVDQRRRDVGLTSLAEYAERMRTVYGPEGTGLKK